MRWRRASDERGSAVSEFIVIAVLVLIPIAYGVLSIVRVQSASFASAQAVREAGRAFMTADAVLQAKVRAESAARLALADHGFTLPAGALDVACPSGPCLSPGSAATVTLQWTVELPWFPAGFGQIAAMPISATHHVPVDAYRLTAS